MEKRCVTDLPFCVGLPILFCFRRGARIPSSAPTWGVLTGLRSATGIWSCPGKCWMVCFWPLCGSRQRSLRPLLSGIWITMKSPLTCFWSCLCYWSPSRFVHHSESVLASPPQSVDPPGLNSAFLFFLWPPLGGQNPCSVFLCNPPIFRVSVIKEQQVRWTYLRSVSKGPLSVCVACSVC